MGRSEFADAVGAARASIRAGRFDEAQQRYRALVDRAIADGRNDDAVRGLLELVVQLADAGEHARAQDQFDRAMLFAFEVGFPLDRGDFKFAEGELFVARGDDAEAVQRFVAASEEFNAAERDLEFAAAVSRYAWAVDRAGTRRQALAAHRVAARAFQAVLDDGPGYAYPLAQHLREVGRAEFALNGSTTEGASEALRAYIEARNRFRELARLEDLAETDLEIGALYVSMDRPSQARVHWEAAAGLLSALGNHARAREVAEAMGELEPPAAGRGKEF